jgi:Group II intron, maturase-specific domain
MPANRRIWQGCWDFLKIENHDRPAWIHIPRTSWIGGSPSKKSVQRIKTKVSDLLIPGNKSAWPEVCARLNRLLGGWAAYFSHGSLAPAYQAVDRMSMTEYAIFCAIGIKRQVAARNSSLASMCTGNGACCS